MLRVGEDLTRIALFDDDPTVHEHQLISDLAGESHLVRDHAVSYTHLTLPTICSV